MTLASEINENPCKNIYTNLKRPKGSLWIKWAKMYLTGSKELFN